MFTLISVFFVIVVSLITTGVAAVYEVFSLASIVNKVDSIVEPPCSISIVIVLPTGAVFTEPLTPSIPASNVKS